MQKLVKKRADEIGINAREMFEHLKIELDYDNQLEQVFLSLQQGPKVSPPESPLEALNNNDNSFESPNNI